MYNDTGGKTITVQGLECILPPEGYVVDYKNGNLKRIGIYKRANNFSNCYWEIDPRWEKYQSWKKEEDAIRQKTPNFVHKELAEFISDMWTFRMGGFWFYNNTTPTYITGKHWFYLSCIHIDVGRPSYRDADREFFYFWDYVCEDPACYGGVLVTKRRSGKTYIGGSIALEETTRKMKFNSGIQSKTDPDAKGVFRKAIIAPYRKMPYFFKPEKSNMESNGKMPAGELRFIGSGSDDADDELDSLIDFKPSTEVAYDGTKLGYYFADEVGKPQNVNVNVRWDVVLFCLRDSDGSIIGKTLHTTTVEDMGGSSRDFFEMWDGSNQENKINGRTVTGMYRFFISGAKVRCLDKYGVADVDKATKSILREREAVSSNPRALSSLIRKDPLNVKEAFQTDSESCAYDTTALNEREDILKWSPPMYEVGNLHWVNNEQDGDVEFIPNPNGRFKIAYHPLEHQKNAQIFKGNRFMPANNASFKAGVDTYDTKFTETPNGSKKLSLGSIVVMKGEDPMAPSIVDNGAACLYLHRPLDPDVFYEDVIKCLKYYGCEALIETNKAGLSRHMEKRGYDLYSALLPNKTQRGIYAGAASNIFISELNDQYISGTRCEKIVFVELIEQWKEFNSDNTTDYDAAMAFGYALMLMNYRHKKAKGKEVQRDVREFLSFWGR